jgi:DNA-binding NarL/FixJ family response regulator
MESPATSVQPKRPILIWIADRNYMSSQLLAESLGRDSRFQVAAIPTASSNAEILSTVGARRPQVAVISADFDGSPKRGLQLAKAIHRHDRSIRILILLEMNAPESVIAAFRCGAEGVFCRNQPLSQFPDCIERVSRGEIWANDVQTEFLLEALRGAPSCDGIDNEGVNSLSRREVQVAESAVQGFSNKQIADQFGLSDHTVKNYLSRVFNKLGVSSRAELLFVLFNGGTELCSRALGPSLFGLGNSLDAYLKAAEEGFAAAQFIVGLAFLDGNGVEKDNHLAYYWLRLAEENSADVEERSRALTHELRTGMDPGDIEGVETNISKRIPDQQIRKKKLGALLKPLRSDGRAALRGSHVLESTARKQDSPYVKAVGPGIIERDQLARIRKSTFSDAANSNPVDSSSPRETTD